MDAEKEKQLLPFGQYKKDLFCKLGFDFVRGKKILDIGCGDGSDAEIFANVMGLDVYGIDVYKNERIDKINGLKFKMAGVQNIPFEDGMFDYVFLHDVLHHVDEQHQSREQHRAGLLEIKRVTKAGGNVIVVEGNRYNPLFYPHMVKMCGHDHWRQSYFIKTINEVYENANFKFFECHFYPARYLWFWKIYEGLMERFSPKCFLAYNVAIINM